MGAERLYEEMKGHLIHKIAPTLNSTVRGNFQVRVIGIVNNAVELELRVVDDNKQPIKSFGSKVVTAGRTVTLEGIDSTINFLPKEV